MSDSQDLYDKRETGKLSLQAFFLEAGENVFDDVSNDIILLREEQLKFLLSKLENNKLHDEEYFHNDWEVIYVKQELKALAEMKISYAFKNFETKAKLLLNSSYKNIDKKMFKWEFMTEFLKSKKIEMSKLKNFKEVNELRLVNNTIKHSDSLINNETKNITEFKGKRSIDYKNILAFYARVESAPFNFLSNLSDLIFLDLYAFNDKRLDKIAEDIALRMDKVKAEKLIEKIKEKY